MATSNDKKNIAVLVSGNGTNLEKIIEKINDGTINGEIKIVISNKSDAFAIERCKNHNINFEIILIEKGLTREDYDKKVIKSLKSANTDLVVLAGFMRLLSPHFIETYPNKIMNIHPSLLPSFPGLDVQEQAINYGAKYSGATVHFVDTGLDTGPIIIQSTVEITGTDTVKTLTEKIHIEEYKIYPEAVRLFCDDKLLVNNRTVTVL